VIKTTCTPEVTELFCDAIRLGLSYRDAARVAGIAPRTANDWRAQGREEIEPYATFLAAVERAQGEGAQARLELIMGAALKDWKAAAWIQERRDPADYGTHRLEVTGADGAPLQMSRTEIVIVPAEVPPEQWEAFATRELSRAKAIRVEAEGEG